MNSGLSRCYITAKHFERQTNPMIFCNHGECIMNLEEKTIGDISGTFKIEAYQRGYRWGKDEVEYLLEDIYEVPDGQRYCLQPVVVKPIQIGVYELIDGQQRLTTIYLIMKYLLRKQGEKNNFSLDYTTRTDSQKFLEAISETNISDRPCNIDELFIGNAYKVICTWFGGDWRKESAFLGKLQNVTLIWYEAGEHENSTDIFTRLNIGKISLTNAELVKALFLSRGKKSSDGRYTGNPYGIGEKAQYEIALRWDVMEKDLHDEKFWAFITNEDPSRYPIRMELLFDMIEMKPNRDNNFYTFNRFYKKFKNSDDRYKTWELIESYMQQLKEWYNDFDLFHHIGFLVATGKNIKELLDIAMSREKPITKSAFRTKVLDMIREHMDFKTTENGQEKQLDYAELNYEQHYDCLKDILLLFNVETIRQKGDENNRFPFNRYKTEGKWSLEHIHAQNSESLKTAEEWKEWLTLHRTSLEELEKSPGVDQATRDAVTRSLAEIATVISHINTKHYQGSVRTEFNAAATEVVRILSPGDDKSQMHTLSNMALLTVRENSALNNATFDAKRIKILEMDKAGEYIPVCTRNVFLKYYSTADTKLYFWADRDRKEYIRAMNNVLYGDEGADETDSEKKQIKLIREKIHYGN